MDGPSLSVRDSRQVVVATNSALHKAIGSLNKIINNDTNSSSVSTTDSGRDSLVDSPVNQNAKIQIHHQLNVNSSNNHIKSLSYLQQQQQQHKQQLLNTANMTTPSSCVSVSIDMNSAGSNSNLKMNTSSNFSDDCC